MNQKMQTALHYMVSKNPSLWSRQLLCAWWLWDGLLPTPWESTQCFTSPGSSQCMRATFFPILALLFLFASLMVAERLTVSCQLKGPEERLWVPAPTTVDLIKEFHDRHPNQPSHRGQGPPLLRLSALICLLSVLYESLSSATLRNRYHLINPLRTSILVWGVMLRGRLPSTEVGVLESLHWLLGLPQLYTSKSTLFTRLWLTFLIGVSHRDNLLTASVLQVSWSGDASKISST